MRKEITVLFVLLAVYHCEAAIGDLFTIPQKIFTTFTDVFTGGKVHSQNPNQKAAVEPPQRSASQKIADEQGNNNFNQNLNLNDNTGDVNLQSMGTANKQNYGNYTSRT
ncbi:uncharacterized protein LOC106710610 [Papilio machaon]|uniref:uncharacterized protein LOC106710610 n=1 Tax=Papilio machaon TaxID=76193 RepID=UPI001E6643C3|nr:uncharacterized protein LOC106710610 [Papilio machaon]